MDVNVVFNGVLQKAFIRENCVSILFLLFFSFLLSFHSRRGKRHTFIELQPQPLSGRDQALREHTFFVFSRASIINFANYNARFCLYPLISIEIEGFVEESLLDFFFSKIQRSKIEEESRIRILSFNRAMWSLRLKLDIFPSLSCISIVNRWKILFVQR